MKIGNCLLDRHQFGCCAGCGSRLDGIISGLAPDGADLDMSTIAPDTSRSILS